MPDFIDLTMRVRKEKLGDLVTDMPTYCQPINWKVVREIIINESKSTLPVQRRTTPPELVDKILTLHKQGETPSNISKELNLKSWVVYNVLRTHKLKVNETPGKKLRRWKTIPPELVEKVQAMIVAGATPLEVMGMTKISDSTFYRIKRGMNP